MEKKNRFGKVRGFRVYIRLYEKEDGKTASPSTRSASMTVYNTNLGEVVRVIEQAIAEAFGVAE